MTNTSRITIAAGLALILLGGLTFSAPAPAPAPASKQGWWVRVDTRKTEANSMDLQIGTSARDRRSWRTWRAGDPAEFDVPADLLNAPRLYLHATANPKGKEVEFCVFYKDAGVEHFDFDDDEDEHMKQTDRDDDCK